MQTSAGVDDGSRGFHSGAVPGHAWQMSALRPAAVAIHDYGDMSGQASCIEPFEQVRLIAAGRFK